MKVGLALGSNLGDRLQHLRQAKRYLVSLSREGWHLASPLYETEPVECPPDTPKFLNAVVEIECDGEPSNLLQQLLAYERASGRDRTDGKNAARTLDIDILYFGEREMMEEDLIIPHPRMTRRRFVLLPLSTIRPDLIVRGTGKTVCQLLRELPEGQGSVTFVQQEW
jgi:2-amino-4-hydroxy-6-hydroxymethyldihydropteridine diphosphokinase